MCWEDVVKAPPSEARTVIPDTGVLVGLADMLSMDLLDTYMRNTRQNAIQNLDHDSGKAKNHIVESLRKALQDVESLRKALQGPKESVRVLRNWLLPAICAAGPPRCPATRGLEMG